MKIAKIIVAALIITSVGLYEQATVSAAEPKSAEASEWISITSNSDDNRFYSGKSGSFEITTTKGGVSVAMLLGQINDKVKKTVTYKKWYVSTSDCESGMGKLVALTISGDYDFEADYVAKGDSIASYIADTICSVYRSNIEAREAKGV